MTRNPKIDPASPAAIVAAKFHPKGKPGAKALADAIGRTPSTVQVWLERGWIAPPEYPAIIAAGAKLANPVTQEDFIDRRPAPTPEAVNG